MKSSRTLRTLHVVIVLLFLFSNEPVAFASHIGSANLTYYHLGGNNYRLHYAYYRDCFGIGAPGQVMITAESSSCGLSANYTLPMIPGTGSVVSLPCYNALTTCNGGTAIGFQKWEYETDVTIPGQCPDWIFYTTDCCRSVVITTIENPGSANLYVEARLNNQISDNNSPQFLNDPLFIACVGQDFHYNNGMFDPDGDSLAYTLICPRSSGNNCLTYNPGYSATQPLSSNPPITFDSFTGDFFMHPLAQEVGVIAYQVTEYRNGELIGSVLRDMIIYTTLCSNNNPTATHMNGTSQQFAYVFPTDTICFHIFSDDLDVSDSVTLSWNQGIPGGTFSTTNALHQSGTFCWVPSLTDVRSNPWMFTAMARDNWCPLNNAGVYSYYIYVTLDSALVFLSAESAAQHSLFSIFPNPSSGDFSIKGIDGIIEVTVYNTLGECILRQGNQSSINLSSRKDGLYVVRATKQDGNSIMKLILKN